MFETTGDVSRVLQVLSFPRLFCSRWRCHSTIAATSGIMSLMMLVGKLCIRAWGFAHAGNVFVLSSDWIGYEPWSFEYHLAFLR